MKQSSCKHKIKLNFFVTLIFRVHLAFIFVFSSFFYDLVLRTFIWLPELIMSLKKMLKHERLKSLCFYLSKVFCEQAPSDIQTNISPLLCRVLMLKLGKQAASPDLSGRRGEQTACVSCCKSSMFKIQRSKCRLISFARLCIGTSVLYFLVYE